MMKFSQIVRYNTILVFNILLFRQTCGFLYNLTQKRGAAKKILKIHPSFRKNIFLLVNSDKYCVRM